MILARANLKNLIFDGFSWTKIWEKEEERFLDFGLKKKKMNSIWFYTHAQIFVN